MCVCVVLSGVKFRDDYEQLMYIETCIEVVDWERDVDDEGWC